MFANEKEISLAIIGSGYMGNRHTYGYDRYNQYRAEGSPQIKKAIMCSRNVTAQRAAELGWEETEQDWQAVVKRPDIDAVDISCWDGLHYTVAKAALEQGKHIICEKPLADNALQAQELAALAQQKGLQAAVCMNYRYLPALQYIKKLLEESTLGEIRHVEGSFTMDWAVDASAPMYWRLDHRHSPNGALGDLGTHLIDLCCFWGLPFREVCGFEEVYGKNRPSPQGMVSTAANELCLFNARFANDALGSFAVSRVSGGGDMTLAMHGTKGSLRWEKSRREGLQLYLPGKTQQKSLYQYTELRELMPGVSYPWGADFSQADTFALLFRDFFGQDGGFPTLEESVQVCRIIDGVLASARKKRAVAV